MKTLNIIHSKGYTSSDGSFNGKINSIKKERIDSVSYKKEPSNHASHRRKNLPSIYSANLGLFSSTDSSFNELAKLAKNRSNILSFSETSDSPNLSFNGRDIKRHQNYFDQMINFNYPSGNWVNIKV